MSAEQPARYRWLMNFSDPRVAHLTCTNKISNGITHRACTGESIVVNYHLATMPDKQKRCSKCLNKISELEIEND